MLLLGLLALLLAGVDAQVDCHGVPSLPPPFLRLSPFLSLVGGGRRLFVAGTALARSWTMLGIHSVVACTSSPTTFPQAPPPPSVPPPPASSSSPSPSSKFGGGGASIGIAVAVILGIAAAITGW